MWFIRWVMFLPTSMLVLREMLPVPQASFRKTVLMGMLLKLLITEVLRTIMETLQFSHLNLFFFVISPKRNSKNRQKRLQIEKQK